jgi:hypothetical protein
MRYPFELILDVLVSISAILLQEDSFNVLQNNSIIDQLPIPGYGHLTTFTATYVISPLVVNAASWKT